jgi:DNA segregation ATPase FtsK/SpoIIIE-like protein
MEKLITLGRTVTGENVKFSPVQGHTLLTGRTRSGKSVQVYTMFCQLKELSVRIVGIDPTGILFNCLGDFPGYDQRVLTLKEPEKAKSVMASIVAEMDERICLLLSKKLDKFTEFSSEFPAIICVLEEYPGTLAALRSIDEANGNKGNARIETQIRANIQRIALEGAKCGIFLWIIAQRADSSLLTGVLRSQLVNRLSFAQDPDGLRMLHESITPEQIEMAQYFRPGQAFAELVNHPGLIQYRSDICTYQQLMNIFNFRESKEVNGASSSETV